MSNKNIKIAIGMSGGVDSSVSAMLLKEQGYDVVGVFMKFWHDSSCDISRENACCDEKALMDARKVADRIGIPLYTVDVRSQFKESVTDYFIDEYKNLRTPNPCVVCNKKIKFGWFLDFARKIGCEKVATGHYARIIDSEISKSEFLISNKNLKLKNQKSNVILSEVKDLFVSNYSLQGDPSPSRTSVQDDNNKNVYSLLKGVDQSKDQTYFLYQLNQEQLAHIIFPVGEMTKDQVRELARKDDLPTSEKRESQEVCFVPDDYRSFLKRHLGKEYFESGDIVDRDGNIIGKHEGLVNYTIGQRKGIDQSISKSKFLIHSTNAHDRFSNKNPNSEMTNDKIPLYVIGFDKENNRLIVGRELDLYKDEAIVADFRLINPELENKILDMKDCDLKVKIRYRAKEISCRITKIQDTIRSTSSGQAYKIHFSEPERAIASGQSAVFYLGDKVVGGGTIC